MFLYANLIVAEFCIGYKRRCGKIYTYTLNPCVQHTVEKTMHSPVTLSERFLHVRQYKNNVFINSYFLVFYFF